MPRWRPQASWWRQVESYLRDSLGMAGLASEWAMARRRPFMKNRCMAGPASLGDGQTEGEGVPSQGGCGKRLRRMSPYLT